MTSIPLENVVIRNPNFGIKDHPHASIKAILVQKIDDPNSDQGISTLVLESEYDPEYQDIFLNTIVGPDDKGFSSVVDAGKRITVIERFVGYGWKLELL